MIWPVALAPLEDLWVDFHAAGGEFAGDAGRGTRGERFAIGSRSKDVFEGDALWISTGHLGDTNDALTTAVSTTELHGHIEDLADGLACSLDG